MKTTEQLTLTQRLLEFQKQINVIKKDAKNPHFKNTYATLKQVLSEVKPILKADTEHFGKAVEYLMKGGSIDAIKQKYDVSQEVETKLIKSI